MAEGKKLAEIPFEVLFQASRAQIRALEEQLLSYRATLDMTKMQVERLIREYLDEIEQFKAKMDADLGALRAAMPEVPELPAQPRLWEPKGLGWSLGLSSNDPVPFNTAWCDARSVIDNGRCRSTKDRARKDADQLRRIARMQAYRDEFAPEYVEPPASEAAWRVFRYDDGRWVAGFQKGARNPEIVYFPQEVARALVDKLNRGEVVF